MGRACRGKRAGLLRLTEYRGVCVRACVCAFVRSFGVYMLTFVQQLVPENSIINAAQFPGPAELARYLLYLNSSDWEYEKFFRWRSRLPDKPPGFEQMLLAAVANPLCNIPPLIDWI